MKQKIQVDQNQELLRSNFLAGKLRITKLANIKKCRAQRPWFIGAVDMHSTASVFLKQVACKQLG